MLPCIGGENLFAAPGAQIFIENTAIDDGDWKLPDSFQVCPQTQIRQDFPSSCLLCLPRPHPTLPPSFGTLHISFLEKDLNIGGALSVFQSRVKPKDGMCAYLRKKQGGQAESVGYGAELLTQLLFRDRDHTALVAAKPAAFLCPRTGLICDAPLKTRLFPNSPGTIAFSPWSRKGDSHKKRR